MTRTILNRWSGAVIWTGEAETVKSALMQAFAARAVLRDADLTGAVLTDAVGASAPTIAHIDAAILQAIAAENCALDMGSWHTCETTHCRAGWAITLAGAAGRILEDRIGSAAAGALIYAASRPGQPVPDFYDSTEEALADLQRGAAADPLPA